jgi:hypothetical protein
MKKVFLLLLLASPVLGAASRVRHEVAFPDLPGYTTLRCDFHLHTVFSDGVVWPTLRVEEAWRDGLDVISITDHNEYQRFKDDVPPKVGRSDELAGPVAAGLGLLLVRGCEITRGEPPGHLNALFVQDIAAVKRDDSRAAVQSAYEQGAFIFWNHPGWKQPERKSVWYAEQEEFFRNGWLKGIEVVNGQNYDPIVHGWAGEKGLTLMANSDVHDLTAWQYDRARGQLRPMTLVFAREKSAAAVKEALLARRTVVFAGGQLCGEEALLRPFVERCLEVATPEVLLQGKARATVQLRNRSATVLQLKFPTAVGGLKGPAQIDLAPNTVTAVDFTRADKAPLGQRTVKLPCLVTNALTAPGVPLRIELAVPVRVEP